MANNSSSSDNLEPIIRITSTLTARQGHCVAEGGVSNINIYIGAGFIDTVVVYNKCLVTMSQQHH